jgi:hypothetical protein
MAAEDWIKFLIQNICEGAGAVYLGNARLEEKNVSKKRR